MQDNDYEEAIQKMKDLIDTAAWNAAVSDDEKHIVKFRKMQRVARKFAKESGDKELDRYFAQALRRAERNVNAPGPANYCLFDLLEV